jgi:transposase
MIVIGIDISKQTFDVCLRVGKKKIKTSFENNDAGFRKLLNLVTTKNLAEPHFCMEASGCYHEALAEFLYNNGFKVSVVNPFQTKHFRESKLVRQKTDKSDASLIADFCEQNNPKLWEPKPDENKELSDINRHIENLKEERNRWKNRLEKAHKNKLVEQSILRKIAENRKRDR